MSIRFKLLLSYAAMLIVPLTIMLITARLLFIVFHGDIQSIRDQFGEKGAVFENHNVERIVKELRRTAGNNPSLLVEDTTFLTDIDQELQANNAKLIVRKSNSYTYVSPSLPQTDSLTQLPSKVDRPLHVEREKPQLYGKEWLAVTHFDFISADTQTGSVFVVTTVNPFVNFAQKFFPILFITLIIILILTHSLLTYFVSRSLITPLRQLQYAMNRMKAGDLNVQVQITTKDEIGELSIAFEQMRRQLSKSIETLIQYEENRKELISNISHDLRTPLTAIKGYVDGLGDGIADTPAKRQKYIEIISSKAEEMDHLIDELFLYSKLDLKQLPFNFEIIDLRTFLVDVSEELEFELGKKGIHYTSDITLGQTEVSIDRDKIKRVFSNIIDNCLKYMNKAENHIHLRAYTSTPNIVIEIEDNGEGIEAEALPHIFERFYRADPSRNSHTGGSGLGLAISKQIIEGHDGSIRAVSVKKAGTRISILLPNRTNKDGGQT